MIILMTYYLPVNVILTSSIKFIFSYLSNQTELVKIKTSHIDRKTKFSGFTDKYFIMKLLRWDGCFTVTLAP